VAHIVRQPREQARRNAGQAGGDRTRMAEQPSAHAVGQQQRRRRQRRRHNQIRPRADASQQAQRQKPARADAFARAQPRRQPGGRDQRQGLHEQRHHVAAARGHLELEVHRRPRQPRQHRRQPSPRPGDRARPAPQHPQRRQREQHRAEVHRKAGRPQQAHHQRAGHRFEAAHVGLPVEKDRKLLQRRHVAGHQRHHGGIGLGEAPHGPRPPDAQARRRRQCQHRQDVGTEHPLDHGFASAGAHGLNGGSGRRNSVRSARHADGSRSPRSRCRRAGCR
jgi:hypothetical protein